MNLGDTHSSSDTSTVADSIPAAHRQTPIRRFGLPRVPLCHRRGQRGGPALFVPSLHERITSHPTAACEPILNTHAKACNPNAGQRGMKGQQISETMMTALAHTISSLKPALARLPGMCPVSEPESIGSAPARRKPHSP